MTQTPIYDALKAEQAATAAPKQDTPPTEHAETKSQGLPWLRFFRG